jgi:hypothetical protein
MARISPHYYRAAMHLQQELSVNRCFLDSRWLWSRKAGTAIALNQYSAN